jgi:uncharacterized protein YndB with AHSA1/START domain
MSDTPTSPDPDPEGKRAIDVSVEIDASPEQVWEAIATGPGISAWFVPATVDDHEGGKMRLSFGDMGDETAVLTAWEPPHRWVASWGEWGSTEGSALELLVEARDGGSCVVRLVHSGFDVGAEWDDEVDQTTAGWKGFLHNLQLYVTRFAPQRASMIFSHGGWAGPQADAWAGLLGRLGLPTTAEGLAAGERVTTSPEAVAAGAPQIAGVVSRLEGGTLTVLVDEPGDGYAIVAAEGPDGGVFMNLSAYLFGDRAATTAERETPRWVAWMAQHFPHP